jgi:Ion channel
MNRLHLVLLGMCNRTFGPCLATTDGILCFSDMLRSRWAPCILEVPPHWLAARPLTALLPPPRRYVFSLYWSVVTFATVGYGDFSAKSTPEAIFALSFIILNIFINSYILGTITLMVVKGDERTGRYRDRSGNLKAYTAVNHLPKASIGLRGPLVWRFSGSGVHGLTEQLFAWKRACWLVLCVCLRACAMPWNVRVRRAASAVPEHLLARFLFEWIPHQNGHG